MLAAGAVESRGAIEAVAIEESGSRQADLGGSHREMLGERASAKDAEGAAGVEFGVRHGFGLCSQEHIQILPIAQFFEADRRNGAAPRLCHPEAHRLSPERM
jgi:hypothetical protein